MPRSSPRRTPLCWTQLDCVDCLITNPEYPLTAQGASPRCSYHRPLHDSWRRAADQFNYRQRQAHPTDPSAQKRAAPWVPPPLPPHLAGKVTLTWETEEELRTLLDRLRRDRDPLDRWLSEGGPPPPARVLREVLEGLSRLDDRLRRIFDQDLDQGPGTSA